MCDSCEPWSFLCYLSWISSLSSSGFVPSILLEALNEANKRDVSLPRETDEAGLIVKRAKETYSSYSAEDHACIERYAVEHWTPSLKSLKLSSMVSERLAFLMHLMDSRTLAVTRLSSIVSMVVVMNYYQHKTYCFL